MVKVLMRSHIPQEIKVKRKEMQGVWNAITSSRPVEVSNRVKVVVPKEINGLFVPIDKSVNPHDVSINGGNTILGTLQDISTRYLLTNAENCLARDAQTTIVAWYRKDYQRVKRYEDLNVRVSHAMCQPMYGPIVVTGVLKNYVYTPYPDNVHYLIKIPVVVDVAPQDDIEEVIVVQKHPTPKKKKKKKRKTSSRRNRSKRRK